ncbi:MAG: hypothetical protein P4L28_06130 [Paludibacteraceae bacterium]|nr:hypothetical protein [Paludibacteraceae bacterium]
MKTEDLLSLAEEKTGAKFIGTLRKTARIRHGIGSSIEDVLGWDTILKAKDGECYEFYAAQAPLIGLTQAQPISCPLGIVAFDSFKIDIKEAIKIFHSQNGGDKFTHITLSWPLVYPEAKEPFWYFRTNLGVEVIIGANSGQIKNVLPTVILYMAKPQ